MKDEGEDDTIKRDILERQPLSVADHPLNRAALRHSQVFGERNKTG